MSTKKQIRLVIPYKGNEDLILVKYFGVFLLYFEGVKFEDYPEILLRFRAGKDLSFKVSSLDRKEMEMQLSSAKIKYFLFPGENTKT